MRSASRWAGMLAGAAAVSLLGTATATAGIPKFSPKTIVTGKSIGGLKIGMTKKEAIKLWGKPDRHQDAGSGAVSYEYTAKSHLDDGTVTPPQQYTTFWVRSNKVIEIEIENAENDAVDPTMNKLKTSKNIKLHSTMAKAQKAYGFPTPAGGEAGQSRGLYTQGKHCTVFYAPQSPYTDIEAIIVGLCSAHVGFL